MTHSASSGAPASSALVRPQTIEERLGSVNHVMDTYFRHGPAATELAQAEGAARAYNRWGTSCMEVFEKQQTRLAEEYTSLCHLKTQIADMDERLADKPPLSDRHGVAMHNALVEERNRLALEYTDRAAHYKKSEEEFRHCVEDFSQRAADTRKRVAGTREIAKNQAEDHRHFFESGNDLAFFARVNRFYAELAQMRRAAGRKFAHGEAFAALGSIRRELGQWAARRFSATGLVIVKAVVSAAQELFFAVDTGAAVVTVSPEMATALDLCQKREPTEVTLAGGVRTTGRPTRLDVISVAGQTARAVDAMVLPTANVGVDGVLGTSFLGRFAYRMDAAADPPLILYPR